MVDSSSTPGPSRGGRRTELEPLPIDVNAAYLKGSSERDLPHTLAVIYALVELMKVSTSKTIQGLTKEFYSAFHTLTTNQNSLGVQAGCQLWENFVSRVEISRDDLGKFKEHLIKEGEMFYNDQGDRSRKAIAEMTAGFISDDCTILTHSYSRVVMRTLLLAHKQNRRINVYVTDAQPTSLGTRTYQELTAAGIPCMVVLDTAIAYVMHRVDMVLVGSEAVMQSGGVNHWLTILWGLVSAVGTYQLGLLAKALSKPFFALAESYKFLKYFPLSQRDLPIPKTQGKPQQDPLTFDMNVLPPQLASTATGAHPGASQSRNVDGLPGRAETVKQNDRNGSRSGIRGQQMTEEMVAYNPKVDYTTPDLIQYIMSDLGEPLTPAGVSQFIVAQYV